MQKQRKFLVIDDNSDGRALLTKTLMRKFPACVVQECQSADSAVTVTARKDLDAIIVHRLWEMDGATLIRALRAANPTVPIVAVSGIDRSQEAIAAGATSFIVYDEWLRIGSLVAELIGAGTESVHPFRVTTARN